MSGNRKIIDLNGYVLVKSISRKNINIDNMENRKYEIKNIR